MSISELLHKKIDLLPADSQQDLLDYIDTLEYELAEKALIKERYENLKSGKVQKHKFEDVIEEILKEAKGNA